MMMCNSYMDILSFACKSYIIYIYNTRIAFNTFLYTLVWNLKISKNSLLTNLWLLTRQLLNNIRLLIIRKEITLQIYMLD